MEIQQLSSSDFERFLTFHGQAYPSHTDIKERFHFQFLDNPLLKDKAQPFILLAYDTQRGRTIVAQYAANPSEYCYGGMTIPCFCGCDLFVQEEKRKYGVGGLLSYKAISTYKPHISIGVSEEARPLLLALQMKKYGEVFPFVWLRFRAVLPVLADRFGIRRGKATGSLAAGSLLYPALPSGSPFKHTSPLDSWSSLPPEKGLFQFSRTTGFLRWRFFSRPGYYFYQYRDQQSYFVLKKVQVRGLNLLAIVDYHCLPGEKAIFHLMLTAAKQIARKNSCDGLLTLSSHSFFDRCLKRGLFFQVGRPFEAYMNAPLSFSPEQIGRREALYITMADSDLEFAFWPKKEVNG